MDSKIILEAIKPDILELIQKGKFEQVLERIEKKTKSIFNFFKTSKEKTHFAYDILPSCSNKSIKPSEYSSVSKLDFKGDFLRK